MVIILILCIIFCFSLLGYKLASYYISRKKFFSSLQVFMSSFKLDVSFSQDKLKNIIEKNSLNVSSPDLTSICSNVCTILDNKKPIDNTILSNVKILKNEEKDFIIKFFSNLGKYDSTNQAKEIDSYLATINEMYINANDECKKYASLFIKLGAIIGVLVCLLII